MKDKALEILDRAIKIAENELANRGKKRCHLCRKTIDGDFVKVSRGKWAKVKYFHIDCFDKVKNEYNGKRVRIETVPAMRR
ncbi:MAG: hypothetical protein J7L80_02960 [Thermoplasmata archaeon]|nr:hypothetical protein [Thermoplasmata archaeon]